MSRKRFVLLVLCVVVAATFNVAADECSLMCPKGQLCVIRQKQEICEAPLTLEPTEPMKAFGNGGGAPFNGK